jgi:hypothetical protein
MFFIAKGRVSYIIENPTIVEYKDMLTGTYFGEIEII